MEDIQLIEIDGNFYQVKPLKKGDLHLKKVEVITVPKEKKPPLSIYTLDELFDEIVNRK